jgi:hypothetical protein
MIETKNALPLAERFFIYFVGKALLFPLYADKI